MANSDPAEWRLYASDLTTQTDILPIKSSHIDMVLNEAGGGEVTIPLDTQAGGNVAVGDFAALYYRGSYRIGFFVENLKYTDISNGENSERVVSMSGRGALAVLDQSVIWSADGLATTRTFTAVTKASILKTLIDEAQARGELATLTYTFTASVDSASVAWTDSENYDLPVGTSLLDIARQFSQTGSFDYTIDLSGGAFILSAYSAGRGSNLASTTYFRIGEQCEEVGRDTRGDEIYNYYLVKWKDGYVAVSDATSITTYGIRSKFLSLEQAQSSASATTYASAKLALTKDPKTNKVIRVYDGINPRLFVNYDLGDTVSLDRFGTVTTDVIKGIQADFDGTDFSHVSIDFNYILEDDTRLAAQLDWLSNQWSTAHDGDLLEVSQGMNIGGANGAVNAIHTYGDYIYIGGAFTTVSGISTNYTAAYQISTHSWTVLTGISATVIKITSVGSTIYCITSSKVYVLSGSAWTSVGTATGTLRSMASDGTSLYVGGSLTLMDAVTINGRVAVRTAGVWSDMEPNPIAYYAESIEYFNGAIHVGFGGATGSALKYMSGGSYSNALNLDGKYIFALKVVGSNLIIASNDNNGGSVSTCTLYSWDGVSAGPGLGSATTIGTITDFLPVNTSVGNGSCSINKYLTDVYFGADFDTIDGVTGFSGIGKYSGGLWSPVGGGVSTAAGDGVTAIEIVNSDVYAGGKFTSAFGIVTNNLSLFVTDFQSMLDHALNDYGGIDHENLSGLLGGTTNEHYHLTSAEYTGTGTGNFVRATSPTLVTPTLGVASATSLAISQITSGALIIGNPTALAPVHFAIESVPGVFIDTYNNTLTSLPFVQRAARGTRASPSAIASGDIIAGITGRGYHSGGAFTTGGKGAFYVIATESWTSSANGSQAIINSVAAGATTPVIRATFDENGIASNFGILSASQTGQGVGYASGAGGTITQATNKSTGVTLDKITGLITMNNAALNAGTTVSFTLTNNTIAATDTIILQHNSAGTAGAYHLNAQPAAGSASIAVRNVTAGNLSEAIVIRFTVIKSVSA